MTILEILKLLFTKIGDTESIHRIFDSISKIPKSLKLALGVVLILGCIYFGYSKMNTEELDTLKQDVIELRNTVNVNIYKDHANDVYYLIKVLELRESFSMYLLDEQLVLIDIMESYIKRKDPNDPTLIDLAAMRERNKRNYDYYHKEFYNIINNINHYDSIRNKDKSNNKIDK